MGWTRWTVAIALACAAWLVTGRSFAAAPLCDTRAATTFAPAPILQPPQASIDVTPEAPCAGGSSTADVARPHSNGAARAAVDAPADAVLTGAIPLGPVPSELLVPLGVRGGPRHGVHRGVERPPRAPR